MNSGWELGYTAFDEIAATMGGERAEVELVGTHLRVAGSIDLGRFARLSDRVNHSRGFILIHDARLLRRNGDATALVVPELYVNQDEITFIAISHVTGTDDRPTGFGTDRPLIVKEPRRYLVFTPGHVISGLAHVYQEMSASGFVDSTDPRFIALTQASTRSLADWRVVSHFDLLLVNRTQMTAVAEAEQAADSEDAPVVETS